MTPLVSIILPTYNGEKYLGKSIESCLSQSYKNIQLIIIDDCSADSTPDIIKQFSEKDKRVISIRNTNNKKLPASLNAGFEIANGQYFTWTSDDNYYAVDAIKEMVEVLEANNNYDLIYTDYIIIDEHGNITGIKKFGDVNKSMVNWKGCGACFLYRAEIHIRLKGYDPSAFLIEDYDFFVRALTIAKFFYLEKSDLYYYRLHKDSLTSLYGFYNFDLQKIVIERQLPKLISIASKRDQIMWYRKFAIYYGVSKNNIERMNYYMKLLFKKSKGQTLITILFIIYRKAMTGLKISVFSFLNLFKLFLNPAEYKNRSYK